MDGTRARALLGVAEHSTHDDVRRAFRRQAFATHPDRGGDAEAFVHTLNAFRALQVHPPLAAVKNEASFEPQCRIDTYDYVAPQHPAHNRVSFQDFLDSAVRQRVAAA